MTAARRHQIATALPNVRAKPGPADGRLAGADDDDTARPRRPSARLLGLGLSEGLGRAARGSALHKAVFELDVKQSNLVHDFL